MFHIRKPSGIDDFNYQKNINPRNKIGLNRGAVIKENKYSRSLLLSAFYKRVSGCFYIGLELRYLKTQRHALFAVHTAVGIFRLKVCLELMALAF